MAALGDRPASKITTREINALLTKVSDDRRSPSTVNKYRAVIVSGVQLRDAREDTFAPERTPQLRTSVESPTRAPLVFYSPEEIEALARALADGLHREPGLRVRDEVREAMRPRSRTPSWSVSPRMPACASASCSRSAGVTSTSPVTR